jgi:hypothetical protein
MDPQIEQDGVVKQFKGAVSDVLTDDFIGLQVHRIRTGADRKFQVRFKSIKLRELTRGEDVK